MLDAFTERMRPRDFAGALAHSNISKDVNESPRRSSMLHYRRGGFSDIGGIATCQAASAPERYRSLSSMSGVEAAERGLSILNGRQSR